MHLQHCHLVIWSRCALCWMPLEGEHVSINLTTPVHEKYNAIDEVAITNFIPDCCPMQSCIRCSEANRSYAFHTACHDVVSRCLPDSAKVNNCWFLRCTQALVQAYEEAGSDPSRNQMPDSLIQPISQLTAAALCEDLFLHLNTIVGAYKIDGELQNLLLLLRDSPYSVQYDVFSSVVQSPGTRLMFKERTIRQLQAFQTWSEPMHRPIRSGGALYARFIVYKRASYLAGIYDEPLEGTVRIKAPNVDWDYVLLYSDDTGIARMSFALAHSSGRHHKPGHFQAIRRPSRAHDVLWITLKGLLVTRVDMFRKPIHQIHWPNSTTFPLSILPAPLSFYDFTATVVSLEGITGISIAQAEQRVKAIHAHKDAPGEKYNYPQRDATWAYCPLNKLANERIQRIWIVSFEKDGFGFLVETTKKTVWLGGYLEPTETRKYQPIAVPSSSGFYHSLGTCSLLSAIPSFNHPVSGPFHTTKTVPKPLDYRWSFSRASLENVQALRKTPRGAVELFYDDFSVCLGDFRPAEAGPWLKAPRWYKVAPYVATHWIDFFDDSTKDADCKPMKGHINFWHLRELTHIQFDPPTTACPTPLLLET
ncbi:hypothetical protein BU24DRAFT_404797 [Aaosphaeria arxii CBS 175.79]|uniref:Heterokaryon incompatibility domain-containing protein n=1 Tax=Aaosphaeria arxii CBS 175.79 TaxID=1450172 RepID=A0A6A5YB71_9PLEO|nr:uncharacterized protein BU24DRAFT_404797 [Aaosphaeria arxii CBS 175.79]KAF2021844.1 hypothetical protein BU24DRAFT_404797 [Aaosphaeria arxii CBS 175.79]